jgi:MATE family multidrug resistance protein
MTTGPQLSREFDTRAFLRLAVPMIISRAGLTTMGIADGIMVSRFQSHEFAWLSLAEGTLGRLLDVFCAFLIGGLVLVPRHFGRGDAKGARAIWLRTIPVALAVGFLGLAIGQFGKPLLLLMGQPLDLAEGAGRAMAIFAWAHPPALLAICAAVYLEGINRPRIVAITVIGANLLNISLNWLFIAGHFGFAAMGARGSALSTTIVRYGLCAVLAGYAWRQRAAQTNTQSAGDAADLAESKRVQWRLSVSSGATVVTMVALGAPLTLFAGWLGTLHLAAFSAVLSLAGPAALIEMGLADAAGVYVGAAAGLSGERKSAAIGWASLRITLVPIAIIVSCLIIWAHACAVFYTKDLGMQVEMIAVIPLIGCNLLIDSVGFVMVASLRALREVTWPTSIEIGSMCLLIPLALWLAFPRGFGIKGLFYSMLTTGIIRATLLAWRFWWRTQNTGFEPDVRTEEFSLNVK